LMYNRSYLENRRKNYSFLVQEDKENWFKTWEKSNLDLLTLLSPCTANGAADNTSCCSAILVVSKPSTWCSLSKYQIRTSTQKTLPWWVGQWWDPLQNPTWAGTLLLLSSSHTSINFNY
jgi:hypothetical protein